jgi:hypothetical protein
MRKACSILARFERFSRSSSLSEAHAWATTVFVDELDAG